jgi:hypothetical protein
MHGWSVARTPFRTVSPGTRVNRPPPTISTAPLAARIVKEEFSPLPHKGAPYSLTSRNDERSSTPAALGLPFGPRRNPRPLTTPLRPGPVPLPLSPGAHGILMASGLVFMPATLGRPGGRRSAALCRAAGPQPGPPGARPRDRPAAWHAPSLPQDACAGPSAAR